MVYLLPFLISTGISLMVGLYCWHRRAETGAITYALIAFSQASWTFGYIFELISPTLAGKIFWDNFQFIGANGWLIAFLAFTLEYIGRRLPRPYLTYSLLSIPSLAIILLAYTDPLHSLIRPQVWLIPGEPFSALLYDFTLPIWSWATYSYGVFLVCILMLVVKYVRSHPLYRTQVGLILIGNLLPLLGTTLTLIGIIRGLYRDTTPFTFAIGNLIVAWGLFRYRLFDVVPLAWDNVVENMSDAVIVLDAQDRVVNLNPIARGMASLEDKEVIGQPTAQVFAAWPEIVATYQNVKETHTEIEVDTTIGLRSVELRIQPLYDPRQRFKGRVVIVRDITKQKQTEAELRKHRDNLEELVAERTAELSLANQQLQQQIIEREQLEAQLRQSQKLEALGRLAGGIAHDFNNLLVPILSYAELSLLHLAPDNKLHTYLVEVKKAAQRAANLVKQMLAFSRQQILDVEVLDLNVIIDEFKLILQSLLGENIELHILISDSLHPLKADKGQMEQVLMNLVINSRDAMPDGGKITIETANIFLDESYVTQYASDLAPGPYVMLAISDTGEGMDTETQAHIFDPFFTTKEVGKGTGLGLATVFGIIKQHRGHLWVDSEPGQGTIFKVYLPHAEVELSPTVTLTTAASIPTYGTETVLVVEDEEIVRNLVCETLQAYGYDVVEAENPTISLQLASSKNKIELLLTDVVMPEMNGKELYQKLVAIHPHSKVMYMSGYTSDVIFSQGILDEGIHFLAKPFTVHNLMLKVRQALD